MLRAPPADKDISGETLSWFNSVYFRLAAITLSGPTANRPVNGVDVGQVYYDTTLNKPVFASALSPITWRDAAGVIV